MALNKTIVLFLIIASSLFCGREAFGSECDSLYIYRYALLNWDLDSASQILNECILDFEQKGDLSKAIDIKLTLLEFYSSRANYPKAFDIAWSLMSVVDSTKFQRQKVMLNMRIASLLVIFEQFNHARLYIDEGIHLLNYFEKDSERRTIRAKLYELESWIAKCEGDINTAIRWLLLAIEENPDIYGVHSDMYLRMTLAELYILNDEISEAEKILKKIEKLTIDKYPMTRTLLFSHIGLVHMKRHNYDSATSYFLECLNAIDEHRNHVDIQVKVLDSLSNCYYYLNQYDRAFKYAQQSMRANEKLFGNRNSIAKKLFSLKSNYEHLLKNNEIQLLRAQRSNLYTKIIVYISLLISVIFGLIIRSKMRTRAMNFLKKRQTFERKQQESEMEIRNKELVSSALQFIEREALIEEIKDNLKSLDLRGTNKKVIDNLLSSINSIKSKKWDEFDLYFKNINEDFYKILKARHGSLSITDLKMSALIKLGLSSKEMADVMGISVGSINTSRSRMRKKMGLPREINLTEYFQSI